MTRLFAFLQILLVAADNNSGLDHYQFLSVSENLESSQMEPFYLVLGREELRNIV